MIRLTARVVVKEELICIGRCVTSSLRRVFSLKAISIMVAVRGLTRGGSGSVTGRILVHLSDTDLKSRPAVWTKAGHVPGAVKFPS